MDWSHATRRDLDVPWTSVHGSLGLKRSLLANSSCSCTFPLETPSSFLDTSVPGTHCTTCAPELKLRSCISEFCKLVSIALSTSGLQECVWILVLSTSCFGECIHECSHGCWHNFRGNGLGESELDWCF